MDRGIPPLARLRTALPAVAIQDLTHSSSEIPNRRAMTRIDAPLCRIRTSSRSRSETTRAADADAIVTDDLDLLAIDPKTTRDRDHHPRQLVEAHKWPAKYFAPAVRKVAEEWPDEHGDIIGASPYSLRRGMISLRIRAGADRQTIAKQCGTGIEMLERSYSFAIEDLEDKGPKTA
jgi:hypothetical protein